MLEQKKRMDAQNYTHSKIEILQSFVSLELQQNFLF
jgi:hypothetical protein